MKKLFLLPILGLLVFAVISCEKDQIEPVSELGNEDLMITTRSNRNAETPFKASFTTDAEVVGVNPPFLVLEILGYGKATHMGKCDLYSDSWVHVGTSKQTGNMTLTAANGDKLYGWFSGDSGTEELPDGTTRNWWNGDFGIGQWLDGTPADGTGRFEGATGSGIYYGGTTDTPDASELTFEGVLINP